HNIAFDSRRLRLIWINRHDLMSDIRRQYTTPDANPKGWRSAAGLKHIPVEEPKSPVRVYEIETCDRSSRHRCIFASRPRFDNVERNGVDHRIYVCAGRALPLINGLLEQGNVEVCTSMEHRCFEYLPVVIWVSGDDFDIFRI